jgi:HAD-superfamily phosphatase, subfamily IIIC/FkbH-like domain
LSLSDTKTLKRYRKISPFEWIYLSAASGFPPFVIQLWIKMPSLPSLEQLENALVIAAAANPGARLVAKHGWWLDSKKKPFIRIVPASEMFSLSHPYLHERLPCGDTPPIEVLYWYETGLVFRCSHALMDAGGLIFFAQETFRALRNEQLSGTTTPISDYEYLAKLKHPHSRAVFRPDKKSPVGPVITDESGFVWETRFISGQVTSVSARIAAALANIPSDMSLHTPNRIMIPVDLRQTDTSLRSTANLSNPLFFEFPADTHWHDCYRDILASFGRHDERTYAWTDAFIPWIPKTVLNRVFLWLHEWQVRNNQYLFSVMSSNVGPINLINFRTPECTPSSVALLPFNVPGSALSLLTLQHDHGMEIAASCPLATGGKGRLGSVLDQLCAELEHGICSKTQSANTVSRVSLKQRIVIASTFVAEPLETVLAFWMKKFSLPTIIEFTPYNQIFQALLDPQRSFVNNKEGINVILLSIEDWIRYTDENSSPHEQIQQLKLNILDLLAAITTAIQQMTVPIIVLITPLSNSTLLPKDYQTCVEEIQQNFLSQLRVITGIYLITPADLYREYPVKNIEDEYANKLGHIPYTQEMYSALATLVARKIISLQSPPYKVIVLDCDNTLWQGICGEIKPQFISVPPGYQMLQQFMLEQHSSGMLLCLCSKNSPEDVDAVFKQCPDMLLNKTHFVISRINWSPKSANILSIAKELQVGLDSFIFIDDNPVECAEVRAHCEGVQVLQLPSDADQIPTFLHHIWAFDHPITTHDAQQRTQQYKQNQQREALRNTAIDFDSFIASLALQVDITPIQKHQLERVAELTRRTNQFNLRPQSRQAAQIQALLNTSNCLTINVHDRFGTYGLTGAVIYQTQEDDLLVDTFLLSCRILGRGVEHQVLTELGKIALQAGCHTILLPFEKTSKNQPALNFLESIESKLRYSDATQVATKCFAIKTEYALHQKQSHSASQTSLKKHNLVQNKPTVSSKYNSALITQIANELNDASKILHATQSSHKLSFQNEKINKPISIETAIIEIVKDLTENTIDVISLDNSLIDMGLSSLQIVMLLAVSAQQFAPNASHDHLYSNLDEFIQDPTLRNLKQHLQKLAVEPHQNNKPDSLT